ncbi:hypothetical protein RRG08_002146 [Elysia crispata]|uniref:Uncharacterized protein n=1 Tax=Elysia crispata TaxID=231223 RepID=A0AAE1DDG4_9GAST|nr:hypothetical protein RRG08_002146 [Elysia crispata]
MGSFDGCEVCELEDLLILSKMKARFHEINFGLYHDDGLGVHKKIPGPQIERNSADIIHTFKDMRLKITIGTKMTIVDFGDVTFNLQDGSFKPYLKANDNPLYINAQSNHSRSVLNEVSLSINKRLKSISCNETVNNEAKKDCGRALCESGHKPMFEYIPKTSTQEEEERKKRRRKK